MAEKSIGYVVPHTHWDREWRYPLWRNRMLLIEFMDLLLDTLEKDPAYRCFVMDGQTAPVLDYLEVRPERTDEVRKHVADGRIAVGPWYTLPDLYPLDGECLIRNLLKGRRESERLGTCLSVGHTSFGWGQTAQFPQIYRGFGIEFVVTAKRVSEERAPDSEFIWEAPDGSRVLATRLGDHARANFFLNAYIPITTGVEYQSPAYRFEWSKAGRAYHEADRDACIKDYFRTGHQDGYFPDRVLEGVEAAWAGTDDTVVKDRRLLMVGCDFTTPAPALSRIVREANEQLTDKELVHGTLEQYAQDVMERIDRGALRTISGELRDGPGPSLSANALATRISIKQLNKRVENVLFRRAEPLCAALAMHGCAYPKGMLDLACAYMLQSHPHDSINGVTQDKTARDTTGRLEQALEIAEVCAEKAVAGLVDRLDLSGFANDDVLLLVVNPRPVPVAQPVRVCVDTPQEANLWDFGVVDSSGGACAVQHIGRREMVVPVHDLNSRPWPFYLDRHDVVIDPGTVPAGGYKVLRVVPGQDFNRLAVFWPPTTKSAGDELACGSREMENEYLKVVVNVDGTITLTDKESGAVHDRIHSFEDAGDVGDYWVYYAPYENRIVGSSGCPARAWLEENGPLQATIVVELTMTVPARGERPDAGVRGASKRSDDTTELVITSRFTLRRGAKRLDVTTVVNNTAEDHRLRLMIPTDIDADVADAAGHFNVDRRPMRPAPDADGNHFVEKRTNPMQRFVDVSGGARGLAVVNNCLTEYELVDDARRTLALTLFRAVRNCICTEFRSAGSFPDQKGGQGLGEITYEYAIYPHAGDWDAGEVHAQADALNAPPRTFQITPHSRGTLPVESSLFAVQPASLELSALKRCADRDTFIVRVFNPTAREVKGTLALSAVIQNAWNVNLNEERTDAIALVDGAVTFVAGPKKIVTVEIEV